MDQHPTRPEPARRPLLLVCAVNDRRAAAVRRAAVVGLGNVPGLDHIDIRTVVPPAGPPPGWLAGAVAATVDRPYALLVESTAVGEAFDLGGRTLTPYPLLQVLVAGVPEAGAAVPVHPAGVSLVALVPAGAPEATRNAAVGWRRWSTGLVVRVLDHGSDLLVDSPTDVLRVACEELGVLPAVIPTGPVVRTPTGAPA
ncbi:hypothetical protein I0C86_28200 [Plantactinospora sp. S1510]|uniref:Uncharacterized protein n=1 Tax=Plantactinospora alkalitolerans TaxID=2789879 RepID=A0ABS0H3B3_9ACTN|nr:hypothetical protein [Plantactinospora alkalitolerans]MBF9132809.1 hypothetical protein [Plantactinospora alkalitolerans]